MFSRVFFALCLGLSAAAVASDKPSCRPYCSNGDHYTDGYAVCGGGECWCQYTIVPKSPACPQPPEKPEKPKKDFPW